MRQKKRNSGNTYFKTIGATERGRGGNSTAWLSPQNIFREMRQKFLNVYTLRYHPPTRKIRKKRFFFSFGPTYPHFCETKVLDLATQFGNLELLVFWGRFLVPTKTVESKISMVSLLFFRSSHFTEILSPPTVFKISGCGLRHSTHN